MSSACCKMNCRYEYLKINNQSPKNELLIVPWLSIFQARPLKLLSNLPAMIKAGSWRERHGISSWNNLEPGTCV